MAFHKYIYVWSCWVMGDKIWALMMSYLFFKMRNLVYSIPPLTWDITIFKVSPLLPQISQFCLIKYIIIQKKERWANYFLNEKFGIQYSIAYVTTSSAEGKWSHKRGGLWWEGAIFLFEDNIFTNYQVIQCCFIYTLLLLHTIYYRGNFKI